MRRLVFDVNIQEQSISCGIFFAEVLGPAVYLMSDTVVYCISIADNAVDGW